MTRFKVVIQKNRKDKHGLVNVEILVRSGKVRVFMLTGFKVLLKQFRSGQVVNHEGSEKINAAIQGQVAGYVEKVMKSDKDIDRMTATQIRKLLTGDVNQRVKFGDIAEAKIKQCKSKGADVTARLLTYCNNVLSERTPGVTFDQITPAYLRSLETDLLQKGIKKNTVAALMRYIRSIFNIAINDDLIPASLYPFRKFKIKTELTVKRNLTIDELVRLRKVEHPAVDIFFLSFFLIGANIRDVLFAKKDQIFEGRFNFTRSKTGKPMSISLLPEALEIIERHSGAHLVLKFMERRKRLDQFNKWINKNLRAAAGSVEIKRNVTTYAARHSWASIASSIGVSVDVISKALGHNSATVTDAYINFDMSQVDNTNRMVADAINKKALQS